MLFIYNQTSISFLKRVTALGKEIMNDEAGLPFKRSRFIYNSHSYPLHFIVFQDSSKLGYFSSKNYEIGISRSLITHLNTAILKNIIRHEIAHLITCLKHGEIQAHGIEFKSICKNYGWGKDVYESKLNLNIEQTFKRDKEDERIFQKVVKLLKLAESSNIHEASLATAKANELISNYNLQSIRDNQSFCNDEDTYMSRVLEGKKATGKFQAIYEILKDFYVYPVFSYYPKGFFLEITGSKLNIDLAEYVAHFLDHELESLWKREKTKHSLSGIHEKNSFMKGIARGMKEKITTQNPKDKNSNEMTIFQHSLDRQSQKVYKKLGQRACSNNLSSKAHQHGIEAGKKLTISPAIKNSSLRKRLLGF